ncbi:MAG TPA: class I SAM-dependent methyltransferase [bacterium]|jgi:SAM-dependent methyltransferase
MDSLTLKQLKQIPWNTRYVSGPDIPPEPPLADIARLVGIPFMKRPVKYALFYSWSEAIKSVGVEPARVLDAACGRGIISQILLFKGHKVSACDILDCFSADKRIDFKRVDLNHEFPYEDDSFDVVINSEGLECLEGSEHFIKETARVLKNGGRLILSIPYIHSLVSRFNFLRSGLLAGYDAALLDRQNILYLPFLKEFFKVVGFHIMVIKGNVPQLTLKSKVFNAVFGDLMFDTNNPVLRFSHSLIITASIAKH